jgi:hypothetical protein
MGSLSNYAENAVMNHITTNSAYTPAATIYLALATGDPGEAATGASMSEVANSGSYARTAITFGAAASRRVTQSGAVTFPAATGSWGTVTHWAIVDSATHGAGNVLAYGAFAASKSIVSGNTPSVASGDVYVEITASTGITNYGANGLLDRMFRNQAFTVSANFVGLWTTTLSDSSTGSSGTEASGTNYARVEINENGGSSPAWGSVSSGAVTNGAAVTFATAGASWGTVVAAAILDASSAGNMLWYDNAVVDQAVASGDTVSLASGDIDLAQS